MNTTSAFHVQLIQRDAAAAQLESPQVPARGKSRRTSAEPSHACERPPRLNLPSSPLSDFVGDLCSSPVSTCDESMNHFPAQATPATPPAPTGSPPAGPFGRLSLDHAEDESPHVGRGRGELLATAAKRAASTELPRPPGRQSPKTCHNSSSQDTHRSGGAPNKRPGRRRRQNCQQQHDVPSRRAAHRNRSDSLKILRPAVKNHDILRKERMDSGYTSMGSRGNSVPDPKASAHVALLPNTIDENSCLTTSPMNDAFKRNDRYPGLILQPDSSPISQDQLAAEVRGIYAGLVMVEAKCINIDAAQAADPKSQLGPEQWQALIALHRTLLYEHHDFLMATQHPTATPALRGLATKYSMPARMWKHGIHAFLEVLRYRRPDSQDHMLSFVYLAYQMMALLFETVPTFTDTWIECLGDLARYRMAIEEEKEAHAAWGGVAARWYTMASDKHPAIGRLYHHLGILERPSLRKLCLYAKSLTCVIAFPNARDSLATLCGPIVQDTATIQSSLQSAEARLVTFHALVFTNGNPDTIMDVASTALDLVLNTPQKLRDFGAYLAVSNTAALFEFGSPTNILFQHYTTAINLAMQSSRPSTIANANSNTQNALASASIIRTAAASPSLETSTKFWFDAFRLILANSCSVSTVDDSSAYIHVMLVCVHSMHSLRTRLLNSQPVENRSFESPVNLADLPWTTLATYLNTVAHSSPISTRLLQYARTGLFLAPERKEDAKPLPEDYLIRGLIWVQFYFRPGWFEGQTDDDGRAIEDAATMQSRLERILWLGLYLAYNTGYLRYDEQRHVFSAASAAACTNEAQDSPSAQVQFVDAGCQTEGFSNQSAASERNSMAPSTSSSTSEDGFHIVKMPEVKQQAPQFPRGNDSWAKVAAKPLSTCKTPLKHDGAKVKIAGYDEMDVSRES